MAESAVKRILKFLFAALALTLFAQVAAPQELYKCKDAAGKITYSGRECSQLGLTSAGEVTGRITVTPGLKPPPAPPESPPTATVKDAAPSAKDGADTAEAPANPERRCFVVKSAKGNVTRCNDVPE